MAWTTNSPNSRVFRQTIADVLNATAAFKLTTDTCTVALYNNSITPDANATAANSAYNAGTWANTNEQSSVGQWGAGGVNLGSKVLDTSTSGVVMYDAADTASGATATLANVFGCLVYENTLTTPVADQGICYNYFGGSNGVTSGVFTVVWNGNGIFRATV